MEKIKTEILDMLNIIFEEKENFNCDNNYLKICNKLRDLIPLIEKENFYNDYLNEKGNRLHIEASRKNLIKDNLRQYKEMIQYRDEYMKLNHKLKQIEKK
tara:strand:+ start:101 stop:400 length:300 start_codon:yes stop_codon:yes gene_type:complete